MKILTTLIFIQFFNLSYSKDFKILKYQDPIAYDYPQFSLINSGIDNIGTFNAEIKFEKRIKDKIIYSYIAHHNRYGFRIFPDIKKAKGTKHLIISGCSFSYGQGLKDQDTFSYKLSQSESDFEVYNMGLLGGRTTDQIYTWRVYNMKKYISQEEGIFIYTFFDDHLNRSIGDSTYYNWVKGETPYYKRVDNDLKLVGPLKDNLYYRFIRFLKDTNLDIYWLRLISHFKHLDIKSEIDQVVFELGILKKEYLKLYPKGRFVVSQLYPFPFLIGLNDTEYFLQKLKENNFEVWESNKENYKIPVVKADSPLVENSYHTNYEILYDGHPNELANEEYFKFISKYIKQ